MKNDESMTSAGIAEDRQVTRKSSGPCSEKSGIDEVKLSDVTAHIRSASTRSDAMMVDMMQRREVMMKQTSEIVLQSVNAQINGINSTINEMREGGGNKRGKIDERFAEVEARLNRLEDTSSRTNATNMNVDEFHRIQEDQNERRAVATGFRDDTKEKEVETLPTSTIVEAGMSIERIQSVPRSQSHMHFCSSQTAKK